VLAAMGRRLSSSAPSSPVAIARRPYTSRRALGVLLTVEAVTVVSTLYSTHPRPALTQGPPGQHAARCSPTGSSAPARTRRDRALRHRTKRRNDLGPTETGPTARRPPKRSRPNQDRETPPDKEPFVACFLAGTPVLLDRHDPADRGDVRPVPPSSPEPATPAPRRSPPGLGRVTAALPNPHPNHGRRRTHPWQPEAPVPANDRAPGSPPLLTPGDLLDTADGAPRPSKPSPRSTTRPVTT